MSNGRLLPVAQFGAAAPVATRPEVAVMGYESAWKFERTDSGGATLQNLRIFKQGTFKDSIGIERTWTDLHLAQMELHYKLLKDGGYLPNVPIRADHSWSVKDVVGYFTSIYRDKDDDTFLNADIEFTEPDAADKWERGTWRSRSLEVGLYETNDGQVFFPVVMGLAFVDLPAVEGLHASQKEDKYRFSIPMTFSKENPVGDQNPTTPPAPNTNASPGHFTLNINGGVTPTEPTTPPTPPTPPTPSPSDPTPPTSVSKFRIGGQETTDVAAVQAHIDLLEKFQSETAEATKIEYVSNLAKDNKIAATQVEGYQNLVKTMTAEQFTAFRAMFDTAPQAPLFAAHGSSGSTTPSNPTTPGAPLATGDDTKPLDEIETAKEVVAQFKRAGKSDEWIKNTPSGRKLVAAGHTI